MGPICNLLSHDFVGLWISFIALSPFISVVFFIVFIAALLKIVFSILTSSYALK